VGRGSPPRPPRGGAGTPRGRRARRARLRADPRALAALGAAAAYAVRSSALEEDGASRSFAGQLESFLRVDAARVADRVAAAGARLQRAPRGLRRETDSPRSRVSRGDRPADGRGGGLRGRVQRRPGLRPPRDRRGRRGARWRTLVSGAVTGTRGASTAPAASWNAHRATPAGPASTMRGCWRRRRSRAARGAVRQPAGHRVDGRGRRLWLLQSRPITTLAGLPTQTRHGCCGTTRTSSRATPASRCPDVLVRAARL